MKPTKSKFTVLKQICELIPRNLVPNLAKKHGVIQKSRSFTPWSHVVSLIFAQLSHAISLNDICDTLSAHEGVLTTVRRAVAPSRNGLSYANRNRNSDMAEALFWKVLEYLQNIAPQFGFGQKYSGIPRRFKRMIHIVDSTTIQLVANCIDWAKHRRRKAAAKCHLRLNLQTFLPNFAVVKEGSTHDASEAKIVCAGVQEGEIIVFDKAYVDFKQLNDLEQRGVFWVTRAKDNMAYEEVTARSVQGPTLNDKTVRLTAKSSYKYSGNLRLIHAKVEVNGEKKTMTFLTNNMKWAASSICDLYKSRWAIEVFFKQLKQTLQLADFLGHSKHAVRWQIWTALLTYVLLRFIAFQAKWKSSFSRLFTALRGVLWETLSMKSVLDCCGTASDPLRFIAVPHQAFLPGFQN